MSEPLLKAEDLSVTYETPRGGLKAVSNATFAIDEEEYVGLVGESGCGKTTLAEAIIGGLSDNGRITSGRIIYDGREIQDMTEKELNEEIRWNEISYIPQSSMNSLDPIRRLSAQAKQIAKTHTDLTEKEALDQFREMFNIVGLREERIHDYPFEFSGGMQQRAIIALALFLNPSLIIADEPTTALDVIMQDQIFKYLDKMKYEVDTSMLLITHDISVVFESCDKITVMHGGQVAETGSVTELFDSPKHPYTFLLQNAFPDIRHRDRDLEVIEGYPPELIGDTDFCTFADRCPLATEECREEAPPLVPASDEGSDGHYAACIHTNRIAELETGRDRQATADTHTITGNEPILEVQNLKKYFSQSDGLIEQLFGDSEQLYAVDDVSLSVHEKEVVGVIGESGCGKSTLLKTLIGLHTPTDGHIRLRGQDTTGFSRKELKQYRRKVQIIFQNPFESLDPKMTIRESLAEPLKIHDMGDRDKRIRDILRKVELQPAEEYLGRLPRQLSGGENQRVAIGRALIVEPDLLLADEPVSMLDVSTQAAILQLLSNLIEEFNTSMLYISHDLSTVSYICDRINVMYLGRFVEEAPTNQILDEPKHPYTRALIQAVPVPDPHHQRPRTDIDGVPQDPVEIGEGCRFRDRCPERMDICEKTPVYYPFGGDEGEQRVACHLHYDHEEYTAESGESKPEVGEDS